MTANLSFSPPLLDSFIVNHSFIDPEIFILWTDGHSPEEAAAVIHQRDDSGTSLQIILSDINQQFRSFDMIEKFLYFPPKLNEQWIFQIDPEAQLMLIEKYYEFDDTVMREILGKKLSSRQRKDLDEVSEKTGITLKSCRRQFDNVKRVFKTIEEMPGSILSNIKLHFYLHDILAKKYSVVIFLTQNRFETTKKKLQYLTFQDFHECSLSLMNNWTTPFKVEEGTSTITDAEREFFMEIKELRFLTEKEKELKSIVLQKGKNKITERILNEIDHNFKSYSRTLLNLAHSLNHTRELKDLFIDLVEKYIEPCKQINWPKSDFKQFLEIYRDAACELEFLKTQTNLKTLWIRFMDGLKGCLTAMYHN